VSGGPFLLLSSQHNLKTTPMGNKNGGFKSFLITLAVILFSVVGFIIKIFINSTPIEDFPSFTPIIFVVIIVASVGYLIYEMFFGKDSFYRKKRLENRAKREEDLKRTHEGKTLKEIYEDEYKKDYILNQKTQTNSEIKQKKKLKLFSFRGRARRKDFWLFALVFFLFGFITLTIDTVFFYTDSGWGPSFTIFMLLLYIPYLAISVRRLHDTGRSGWWLLLGAIPLGGLFLLAFFLDGSEPGINKYGPNPKEYHKSSYYNENNQSSTIVNKKTPKEKTLREIFEEKAEATSKKRGTNWILIALISTILLSLIGGAFYWFEYRPTQIKKDCSWTEYETGKWREARESEYEKCLRRNGILE